MQRGVSPNLSLMLWQNHRRRIFIHPELKLLIEQAVRPLRATAHRKMQFRAELVERAQAIYDEEAKQSHDSREALERTRQRLGTATELSHSLQLRISKLNQALSLVELPVSLQVSHESAIRFYVQSVVAIVLRTVPFLLILRLFLRAIAADPSQVVSLRDVGVITVGLSLFGPVLLRLVDGIRRSLRGDATERSPTRGAIYPLLGIPIVLAMISTWSWLSYGSLPRTESLVIGLIFSPMIPVILVVASHAGAEQIRECEEWAKLQLSE